MMIKHWPGEFDFKRKPGETRDNFESRMRETNTQTTKYDALAKDGRGIRQTKQSGKRFTMPAKPDRGA
jgi:hypothetical protein